MADELTSTRPAATIGGASRTRAEIRARLAAVTAADVAAILDAMRKHPPKVKNPRGYLLTCLYNAPAERITSKADVDTEAKEYAKKLMKRSEVQKYAQDLKRRRAKKKDTNYVDEFMKEMEGKAHEENVD